MTTDTDIITRLAARDGGVVTRRVLLAAGISAGTIDDLRRHDHLIVIRRGWYRLPGADPSVVAAVRSGATVTCVSALPYRDPRIWIPPGSRTTHLRWPRHRSGAGCRAHRPLPSPVRGVDALPEALLCAAHCLPADLLVAVLDSTLRVPGLASERDLREVFRGAPQRITRLLGLLDPAAESGTESVTRYRLLCAHIGIRSQQVILHVGRVDLLVGDKLIVECDSDGYHGGEQRRNDNRRDRISTCGDYRTMRLDYRDVFYDWNAVLADILAIVRTDRHIGKRRW